MFIFIKQGTGWKPELFHFFSNNEETFSNKYALLKVLGSLYCGANF